MSKQRPDDVDLAGRALAAFADRLRAESVHGGERMRVDVEHRRPDKQIVLALFDEAGEELARVVYSYDHNGHRIRTVDWRRRAVPDAA